MKVISGPGKQAADQNEERAKRVQAMGFALEWARSAGPEHATRVPIDEFIDCAKKIEAYLKGESQ